MICLSTSCRWDILVGGLNSARRGTPYIISSAANKSKPSLTLCVHFTLLYSVRRLDTGKLLQQPRQGCWWALERSIFFEAAYVNDASHALHPGGLRGARCEKAALRELLDKWLLRG